MRLVPGLLGLVVGCATPSTDTGRQPFDTGGLPDTDSDTQDSVDTGIDTADSAGDSVDSTDTGPDTADTADSAGDTADTADSGADTADTGTDTALDTADTALDTADTADTAGVPPGPAILLFIGDGMGFEHVKGGGMYVNGAAGSLTMETLPYHGNIRTASLSGTTDSAAASTAMATGSKTYNDRLGLDRDGLEVESLLEKARALGMSVGVVTTDKLTGATPSGFVVHVEDRGDGPAIAAEYLTDLPDVALGGAYLDFAGLFASMSANIVTTRTDLYAAVNDGRPLFGTFSDTTFPFVADGYDAEDPTLAEMTAVALDWLGSDPDGFFLMVEGARIDHASHANDESKVYDEVASFDDAIATALAWVGTRETTMIVTADHECGGLTVSGATAAGVIPTSDWRWGQHTNADVPVFATGTLTNVFDGTRLDDTWVHAVLEATLDDASAVTAPTIPLLVDGTTDDLGAAVTTQSWATSFGAGYNQLDGLHVTADTDGLWIGVDGVFERGDNAVLALVDLDYGAATGLGQTITLSDTVGDLDSTITSTNVVVDVSGVGFDAVFGALGAEEVGLSKTSEAGGLRGLTDDIGDPADYGWQDAVSNFDYGNIADGATATDAAGTGLTENGYEMMLPWSSLFPTAGVPVAGTTIALSVVLVNYGGDYASNQALPSLASSTEPGYADLTVSSVVTLDVDATGAIVGSPAVVP